MNRRGGEGEGRGGEGRERGKRPERGEAAVFAGYKRTCKMSAYYTVQSRFDQFLAEGG